MPIRYDEPLYRPPSEARSVILQVTLGCGWNRCAYCNMYETKRFRTRALDDLLRDLDTLASYFPNARRLFLGDGNALAAPFGILAQVLEAIHTRFPEIQRISSYALPKDILRKSESELDTLRSLGLKLLYVGLESGCADLLRAVGKGETPESAKAGVLRAHQASMRVSVMLINGLGGRAFSKAHALDSANLINEMQPAYLSTLTLFLPRGLEDYRARFVGEYIPQDTPELLVEQKLLIENLHLSETIFRSNHVSNSLRLAGILSRDRDRLISQLDAALEDQEKLPERFSPKWGY